MAFTVTGSSSWKMRTTKRGRPFLSDTLDLFAALAVSLQFSTHEHFFQSYPNTVTTEDLIQTLARATLSRSNHKHDPQDPSRVVTNMTTTTFSMTRDTAMTMCQHLMDARLIEDAANPSSSLFKACSVYAIAPKGLHILERFITCNGVNGDHPEQVFAAQPICTRLFNFERRKDDDDIIVTQPVVHALFRHFVGRQPNYPSNTDARSPSAYSKRSKGIELMEVSEGPDGEPSSHHRHCFMALAALEWLCDFTSVVGREEAAEMLAQFVRFGLIALVSDKRKRHDSSVIFTVRGSAPCSSSSVQEAGEFRCSSQAIYTITDEGLRVAHRDASGSSDNLQGASITYPLEVSSVPDDNYMRLAERLLFVLDQPQLRQAFREFLCNSSREENLDFWIEIEDLKREFARSTSNTPSSTSRDLAAPAQPTKEKEDEAFLQRAFKIYRTYLVSGSLSEVHMDEDLLTSLFEHLSSVIATLTSAATQDGLRAEQLECFNETQILELIGTYECMQAHAFRVLATDWLQKFLYTSHFADLCKKNEEWRVWSMGDTRCSSTESGPSHAISKIPQHEESGSAYFTINL